MNKFIRQCLDQIIKDYPDAHAIEINKQFNNVLKLYIKNKNLNIGIREKSLSGDFLKWKIHEIFDKMGAKVSIGEHNKTNDGIIVFQKSTQKDSILKFVLEVKNHEKGGAQLRDLRQLDDWVFRISGEEKARKEKIFVGVPMLSYGEMSMGPGYFKHPDPHKGVFILNHDTNNLYSKRCAPFGPNEIAFAEMRNFCLIDFLSLIKLYNNWIKNMYSIEDILLAMYKSIGEFNWNHLKAK